MRNAFACLALFPTGRFAGELPGGLRPLHLQHATRGFLLPFFVIYFIHGIKRLFEMENETSAVGNDLPGQMDRCIKILSKFGSSGKSLTEGFF